MRFTRQGTAIRFALTSPYSVECHYHFDRDNDKYRLTMYLLRNDIPDLVYMDDQLITSTKETVERNIESIVFQMHRQNLFKKYIEKYEYMYRCMDIGDTYITGHEEGKK